MGISKLFIFGTTQFSFMIASMLKKELLENEVVGHVVSLSEYEKEKARCEVNNVKLYSLENLQKKFPKQDILILNTIGYSKMNDNRKKIDREIKAFGFQLFTYISKDAYVISSQIGEGCIVMPKAFVGHNVFLGNSNIIYSGAVLTHDINVGDYNFFATNSSVGGFITIGNNCFFGMNSTLKNRIRVDDYTLVGANTFLSCSTEEYDVYVPQKSLKLDKRSLELM